VVVRGEKIRLRLDVDMPWDETDDPSFSAAVARRLTIGDGGTVSDATDADYQKQLKIRRDALFNMESNGGTLTAPIRSECMGIIDKHRSQTKYFLGMLMKSQDWDKKPGDYDLEVVGAFRVFLCVLELMYNMLNRTTPFDSETISLISKYRETLTANIDKVCAMAGEGMVKRSESGTSWIFVVSNPTPDKISHVYLALSAGIFITDMVKTIGLIK
jgi:hypothetical protein